MQQTRLLIYKDQAPEKRKKYWLLPEMFVQWTNHVT